MSAPSSARVDITTQNNSSLLDAFQFDPPPGLTGVTGGTGPYWTMDNKTFRLDIRGTPELSAPLLLSLTSGAGQIVMDSTSLRVLHLNVPESAIQSALVPGKYYYDFIMLDPSVSPSLRIPLMHGEFCVTDGVTGG